MKQSAISISSDVLGGTPVFKGTRVPIQNLFDYLEGGHSLDDFLNGFPSVTKNQVLEVLHLAESILTSEKFLHEDTIR
jgi:uncharacterized protein (DUF433 family)